MSQSAVHKPTLVGTTVSTTESADAVAARDRAPDARLIRRALGISLFDGALFAVMLGTSESYLGALAVELGHGPRELAVLATVPLLAGALAQLLAAPLTLALGGRKRLVVAGAGLQALSLAGFVAIALSGDRRLSSLLAVKVSYWVAGSVIAPAWSSWMETLTRAVARGRYFAWRSALCQLCLLVAFVASGSRLARGADHLLLTFSGLFVIAVAARLLSTGALALQPDMNPLPASDLLGTWRRIREALRTGNWQVPVYLAGLMFGSHIAVPFFTPYMLRDLELDYGTFASLSAISILTKALVYPTTHRVAAAVGLRTLLAVSGFGVAVVPLIWAVSSSLPTLMLAHVLGGAAWAGLEYTSFQLLLDAAHERIKVEFLSLASSLSGIVQVAGALSGGYLLASGFLTYQGVFALSAVLRAAPLGLILFTRPAGFASAPLRRLYTRLVSVLPAAGASQRPLEMAEGDELELVELPGRGDVTQPTPAQTKR